MFINLFISIIVASLSFAEPAIEVAAIGAVKVTVTEIDPLKGTLRVGLYNSASSFPKENSYKGKEVKVTGSTMTFTFNGLPAGKYAIALLHDENNNGEMDFNFIKIPQEGYSFSNKAIPKFREPTFDEAAFTVGSGTVSQTLEVKYW